MAEDALLYAPLTEQVIGAAIEVRRELGPGMLESAYEACLTFELGFRGLAVQRQLELPVHQSQMFTYLRLSALRVGLLINFNVPVLKDGIVRRIL